VHLEACDSWLRKTRFCGIIRVSRVLGRDPMLSGRRGASERRRLESVNLCACNTLHGFPLSGGAKHFEKEVNSLRTYEALFIVRPDMKDEEIQTVADKTAALIAENGGAIVRSEIWGKRRLAYEVEHFSEGYYVLLRFEAAPSFIGRLENYFRLSESVIRHLVVYFDAKTLRLEAEQQQRVEEEVRANADSGDEERNDRPRRSRPDRRRRDEDNDEDEEEADED
jgi:small subunit ribosomal protein S6